VSPGHKHTLTSTDFTDVNLTAVTDGNVLTYSGASSKWINSATSAPDSSTVVKGVTKMSIAPVSPTSPIAVGDNDPRVPTQGENDACVGNNTDVAVGSGNKFVTQTGLQHNAEKYAADGGASDTYAITLSPIPTSYTAGMVVHFKANTANTGAATLNVNSLGAKTIKKWGATDLQDNDILASQLVTVIYDGTNFQMLSMPNYPVNGYELVTATGTLNFNTSSFPTVTVTCSAGKKVLGGGGGFSGGNQAGVVMTQNYPNASNQWTVSYTSTSGTVAATVTVYAIAVNVA